MIKDHVGIEAPKDYHQNFTYFYQKLNQMPDRKHEYSFWTKYKRFATTEILMYLIMIIGIGLGILILS